MSAEEWLLRRALVCVSGLVYWLGVWMQARRVRRLIGRSPNLKPRGRKEKLLWLGWCVVVLIWVVQPLMVGRGGGLPGLGLLPGLVHPVGLWAGAALVGLGYAGTRWCYAALGDAWRIGVSSRDQTALVERGPYRWLRHPIYALQIVMLAGAALLLPTPVSLFALALHYVCVRLKAADEERHLLTVHGAAYQDYASRTGRLWPRWTRSQAGSDVAGDGERR